MTTNPATDRKGDACPLPQPIVLTPSETQLGSGRAESSAAAPGEDRPLAKLE
jgi:hypothetical protein